MYNKGNHTFYEDFLYVAQACSFYLLFLQLFKEIIKLKLYRFGDKYIANSLVSVFSGAIYGESS